MQRNRRNFNQPPHRPQLPQGNKLTYQQRILVEKQQEMLRSMAMNQNAMSLSPQVQNVPLQMNQMLNLLPTVPNLLVANSLLQPVSNQLLTSPLVNPAQGNPLAQIQPSLLGPPPSRNALYDEPANRSDRNFYDGNEGFGRGESRNRSRDDYDGVQGSRGQSSFTEGRGRGSEMWSNSRDNYMYRESSRDDRMLISEERSMGSRSWQNHSGSKDFIQRPDSDRNQMGFKSERPFPNRHDEIRSEGFGNPWANNKEQQREEPSRSSFNPYPSKDNWNNELRIDGRRSKDYDKSDNLSSSYEVGYAKRQKISEEGWRPSQEDTHDRRPWKERSVTSEEKVSSGFIESDKHEKPFKGTTQERSSWSQRSGERETWRDKPKEEVSYEDRRRYQELHDNSFRQFEPNEGSNNRVSEWLHETVDLDRSTNFTSKQSGNKPASRNQACHNSDDERSGNSAVTDKSLSVQEFWKNKQPLKKDIVKPPHNFLYPDPGKLASDVWSRLDSEGGNGLASTNSLNPQADDDSFLIGKDAGESPVIPVDSNLQLQMGQLDNQLERLDERMMQIDSLTSGPTALAPSIWNEGSNLPPPSLMDPLPSNNSSDLRVLLKNRQAKTTSSVGPPNERPKDWNENMVLIYPFLVKNSLMRSDIQDLRTQISGLIHDLMKENRKDVQPRFFGSLIVCSNWLMVHCADNHTVEWLLTWQPKLRTKSKMNLCIRRAVDAVRVARISIFLERIYDSVRNIELRLTYQNQHLEPGMWRRGRHSKTPQGTTVSFIIDAASLRLLEASSFNVYYELSSFKVTVDEYKPITPLVYAK